MLREEDLRIDIGRASHGGDCLRMTHIPTGKTRRHPGPLRRVNQHQLLKTWQEEIEAELLAEGLAEHLVADYPTKTHPPRKRS